ncbi:hypothetical protein EVAR_36948_1 [Eumeta japonica]|uniref:Uncharacterized protein n=1 Tax=Eumeta variegata TaxID=151549 RepID=A0A4C1WAF8_EUMVA|nr:hypothetical protein EVAR_36948_1 [Eumeta japonica]
MSLVLLTSEREYRPCCALHPTSPALRARRSRTAVCTRLREITGRTARQRGWISSTSRGKQTCEKLLADRVGKQQVVTPPLVNTCYLRRTSSALPASWISDGGVLADGGGRKWGGSGSRLMDGEWPFRLISIDVLRLLRWE